MVCGLWSMVQGSRFMVYGLWCMVHGLGFGDPCGHLATRRRRPSRRLLPPRIRLPRVKGLAIRELMAPRTDCTTRISSGVASPVTEHHAAKGSVFVSLRNAGSFKSGRLEKKKTRKPSVDLPAA